LLTEDATAASGLKSLSPEDAMDAMRFKSDPAFPT
jgi:hypothetical protein